MVAVKTLKENASDIEIKDLNSELQVISKKSNRGTRACGKTHRISHCARIGDENARAARECRPTARLLHRRSHSRHSGVREPRQAAGLPAQLAR